jgi:2-polyprenyl-3-methyl-5-hydroxy-6-metoxy-1,4-benzoquinol methylase
VHKDIAGKEYWKQLWGHRVTSPPAEPTGDGITNYVVRKYDEFFHQCLDGLKPDETSILEVGCAGSMWLPYFAQEFGFDITGLDYTENGCAQTEEILERANLNGRIVCADFFSPPEDMIEKYDVVVSFGVAEHFENTSQCLEAFGKFLKPGGILISFIPNMTGAIGFFQKFFDYDNYKIHILLNRRVFEEAHTKAGFIVESCNYFLSVNWAVINLEKWKKDKLVLYKILVRLRSWFSKVFWILEVKAGLRLKPNRLTSPFILCVSKKPCD